MNVITLSGVVVREPELRFIPGSGKAVCNFTLAVKKRFKQENGPDADFINCVVWGKSAEAFANYNQKGARVAVTGELNDKNYEAKDGTKRYDKVVNVAQWEFAGGKKDSGQAAEQTTYGDGYSTDGFQQIEDDDDIPF